MSLTTTQREKARRLWSEGRPMKAIAHDLGITWNEIKHETYWHRDMYPTRYRKNAHAERLRGEGDAE